MPEQILIESKIFQGLTFVVDNVGKTNRKYLSAIEIVTTLKIKHVIEKFDRHAGFGNMNYYLTINSKFKYFVNDNKVNCMTFIDTYEQQALNGFNIVIDQQNKTCKLVKLKCVGCIFSNDDEYSRSTPVDNVIDYIDTCVDCYCCVNCIFCKDCKYCLRSKYLEQCSYCDRSSNCNNCSYVCLSTMCNLCKYCSDCKYCSKTNFVCGSKFTNRCYDCSRLCMSQDCYDAHRINFSSNVTHSLYVDYSKKCNDTKVIQFSNHVNHSRQVRCSNNVFNSFQIRFSSNVNVSKDIRYSSHICVCNKCLRSNICYKSRNLESINCAKFCYNCKYCENIYSCINCRHSMDLFYCNLVYWSWMCFMITESMFDKSIMNCSKALFCQNINKYANKYFNCVLYLQNKTKHSYTVRSNNIVDPTLTSLILSIDEILNKLVNGSLFCHISSNPTRLTNVINCNYYFNEVFIKLTNLVHEQMNTFQNLNENIDKIYEAMKQIKTYSNLIGMHSYSTNQKYNELRQFLTEDKLAIAIQSVFNCFDKNAYVNLMRILKIKPLITKLINVSTSYSDTIMYCNDCSDIHKTYKCNDCNACDELNYCNLCVNSKQCKFTCYIDNCNNCNQCTALSQCKDMSNVTMKYNNSQITTLTCNCCNNIMDCSCGCGKRIENDLNNFYRVYDKDNFLVYIGTQTIGYIYHEMSHQVYKKCYFKTSIDIEKYFENDNYFVSEALNNCFYVETYDLNNNRVN